MGDRKVSDLLLRADSGHIAQMEPDSHIALFKINGPFLLPLPATLAITEKAKGMFLGAAARIFGSNALPEDLCGHDPLCAPLDSSHNHLHVFCLSSNTLQGIDHLGFWKLKPFTPPERDAFPLMNDLYDHPSGGTWVLEPILQGKLADVIERMPAGLKRYFIPSKTWLSATPFLKSRHLRVRRSEKHHRDAYQEALAREIAGNVRFELLNRSYPEPESIRLRSDHLIEPVAAGIHCASFLRTRKVSRGQVMDYGHSLAITFNEPVKGPVLLGKHSHFGMGLFASS